MKTRLLILLFLLCTAIVRAQDNPLPELEPITADNASRLTQLARYGNGIFESNAAWSPDGNTLAVAGSIGIWFYNAEDWSVQPQLMDLDKRVNNIAFSPDGKTLAYSTEDNVTHLVNAANHQETELFKGGTVFAFSPDGEFFAVESVRNANLCDDYCYPSWHVDLWKLSNHEKTITIYSSMKEFAEPQQIVFSSDNKLLTISWVSIESDRCSNAPSEVQVWRMDQLPQSLNDQTPYAKIPHSQYVSISPNNDLIATVVNEPSDQKTGQIRLWDVHTGKERLILTSKYIETWNAIRMLHFNADGTQLTALVNYSNNVMTWDTTTGEQLMDFRFPEAANTLAFSSDGSETLSVIKNALRVWHINETYQQWVLLPLKESFIVPAIGPDGRSFIYYDVEHQPHLWTLNKKGDGEEKGTYSPIVDHLQLLWDHNGNKAVYSNNGFLFIWDIGTGQQTEIDDFSGQSSYRINPAGSLLAYWGSGKLVHIQDTSNAELRTVLDGDFPDGVELVFSPDGNRLLTVNRSEDLINVQLWNVTDGKLIHNFGRYSEYPVQAAFSQDGKQVSLQMSTWLANAQNPDIDKYYQTFIFDTLTGKQVFMNRNTDAIGTLNPDWSLLLIEKHKASSTDIQIIDIATNKFVNQMIHSSEGGQISGFSPDGKRLIMFEEKLNGCDTDFRRMQLYDLTTPNHLATLNLANETSELGFGGQHFSSDSSLLVMDDTYGISLWDTRTGKAMGSFGGRDSYAVFNTDETLLISAGLDGTVRLWGVPH